MTQNIGVDPQSAFARYLQIADRLPRTAAGGLAETGMFTDIAARFDLILFDAYGVLNVGETAIPGATDTIAALRAAGKELGTWNLSGCELYTTWEPCQMCAGAIWWARIDRVYYANLLADAERLGMDFSDLHREVSAPTEGRSRPYERLMGEEAFAVVKRWFDETNPEGI